MKIYTGKYVEHSRTVYLNAVPPFKTGQDVIVVNRDEYVGFLQKRFRLGRQQAENLINVQSKL